MRWRAKRRISWPGHEVAQMDAHQGFHLDDAGGDLDEAQAQRVELRDAPTSNAWASMCAARTSASMW